MHIQPLSLACLLAAALALVPGCEKKQEQRPPAVAAELGRIAVLDLDKVAKSLGWMDEFMSTINAIDQEKRVKLTELQQQMDMVLKSEEEKLGKRPTAEQKDKLAALRLMSEQKLTMARMQVQEEVTRIQKELRDQYRQTIRVPAEKWAKAEGYTAIILNADVLFWSDARSDISDAIAAELKKSGVKPGIPVTGNAAAPGSSAAPDMAPNASDATDSKAALSTPLEKPKPSR